MEFDYDGKHYRYYHSFWTSFSWYTCYQEFDCIQVYTLGHSLIEDGCEEGERSLPIVCVKIKEDKSYDPLVDEFKPCG